MKAAESDKLGLNQNNDYDGECISRRAAAVVCNAYDGSNHLHRASDLFIAVSSSAEVHRARILDLALSAIEELSLIAQCQDSLWLFDIGYGYEALNQAEYMRRFASLHPTLEEMIRVITRGDLNENAVEYQSDHINYQGSRANGVVFANPISLVSMLMDVDKWSATFSNMVYKAINLAVLNQENPNGYMQVMFAEFHLSSPLAKPLQTYFVRCSRQIDAETWVVADVSLETIFPSTVLTTERKPSGCVIQALQHGISRVIWIEHNAECKGIVHSMFKGLIQSGLAFNANRWISTLQRQCDTQATIINTSLNDKGSGAARNGVLKLAERMVRHFNLNILSDAWRVVNVSGADEIHVKTQQIPCGVAVSIASSFWLPLTQNHVFNFLRDEHNRTKWDILSHGLGIEEVVRVSSARNSTDSVSVVSVEPSSTRRAITYLQESFSDSLACYVVYAPVDIPTMHYILQGGSADSVVILPSGLVVLPHGSSAENTTVTVAFQIMDEQLTTPQQLPRRSILTASTLITETISLIRTALLPET